MSNKLPILSQSQNISAISTPKNSKTNLKKNTNSNSTLQLQSSTNNFLMNDEVFQKEIEKEQTNLELVVKHQQLGLEKMIAFEISSMFKKQEQNTRMQYQESQLENLRKEY